MKITLEQAKKIYLAWLGNESGDPAKELLDAIHSVLPNDHEITWMPRPANNEGFDEDAEVIGLYGGMVAHQKGSPSTWGTNVTHYIPWPKEPSDARSKDEGDFDVWWGVPKSGSEYEEAKRIWLAARTK